MAGEILLFLEGVLKISNVILSLIAMIIAISLFAFSKKHETLRPWKVLIFVLIFFAIQEFFGALRAFGIYESPYITHLIPAVILALLIRAVILQQNLNWVRDK